MNWLLILLFLFIGFGTDAFAQSIPLQQAFERSYMLEDSGKYQQAVQPLLDYYSGESYEINMRLGWLYYNDGDFPTSSKYYKVAADLLPYSIEAKLGLALPLSGLGNWDKVVDLYQQILQIDPNNSLVNYRMGSISYYRNDYQKAFSYLEKVVNQYPMDYDSVILFAWTNYRLSKLRQAKVLFQKALLLKPNDDSASQGLTLIQ